MQKPGNKELFQYDLLWMSLIGIIIAVIIFSLIERSRLYAVFLVTLLFAFIIIFKHGRKTICQAKKSAK